MKINEWVLTIVQLAAPITCFASGIYPMGIFLSVWIVIFGIGELVSKKITGKTLSTWVWDMPDGTPRPMKQRVIVAIIMISGMVVLGYHFIWGG